MKKRIFACLLAALMLLSAATAESLEPDAARNEYVARRFSVRKIVGGTVVIAKDGEVVYRFAYGYQDASKKRPVTTDTCFRIASVTKMVSAMGLMRLYDQGAFSLDQPVSELLPFPVIQPACPEIPITTRQILSHTTGFAATNHYRPNWDYLTQRNTPFAKNTTPGAQYIYSNLNGGLIGALMEALSGQSVNSYMTEAFFAPLQINAAYSASMLPNQDNVSNLLNKAGKTAISAQKALSQTYEDTCDPRAHVETTVGGLYISAEGLTKLMTLLLKGGELDGARYLEKSTVELMETDQNTLPDSSVTVNGEYGLGLARVYGLPGGTWYGHQGRKEGLSSNAYYQKETGLTVVVIANGYSPSVKDNVTLLAREMLQLATETWGQ